jgi:hypothetical protein
VLDLAANSATDHGEIMLYELLLLQRSLQAHQHNFHHVRMAQLARPPEQLFTRSNATSLEPPHHEVTIWYGNLWSAQSHRKILQHLVTPQVTSAGNDSYVTASPIESYTGTRMALAIVAAVTGMCGVLLSCLTLCNACGLFKKV